MDTNKCRYRLPYFALEISIVALFENIHYERLFTFINKTSNNAKQALEINQK